MQRPSSTICLEHIPAPIARARLKKATSWLCVDDDKCDDDDDEDEY